MAIVEANPDDRRLVVDHMEYSVGHMLPSDVYAEVYAAGDGFGFMSMEDLHAILDEFGSGYDWSHVRDSTPEGWARMADVLRRHGYGVDAPSPGA